MPRSANAPRQLIQIANSAENRRDEIAMLSRRRESIPFFRIILQPMPQLGPAKLRRVGATAPIECRQGALASDPCNLRRFLPAAVVAPQVVVVERLQLFIQ